MTLLLYQVVRFVPAIHEFQTVLYLEIIFVEYSSWLRVNLKCLLQRVSAGRPRPLHVIDQRAGSDRVLHFQSYLIFDLFSLPAHDAQSRRSIAQSCSSRSPCNYQGCEEWVRLWCQSQIPSCPHHGNTLRAWRVCLSCDHLNSLLNLVN